MKLRSDRIRKNLREMLISGFFILSSGTLGAHADQIVVSVDRENKWSGHGSRNQPKKLLKVDTNFTDQHELNPNAANPPFSNRCQSVQSVSIDLRNSPAQDLLENRGSDHGSTR
jgi:hypothetical protein